MRAFLYLLLVQLLIPSGAMAAEPLQRGLSTRAYSGTPDQIADAFMAEHRGRLGLADTGVTVRHLRSDDWRGRTLRRYQQHHRGVPVLGARLVLKSNARGRVTLAGSTLRDDLTVGTTPAIDGPAAVSAARTSLGMADAALTLPVLSVLPDDHGGTLVYQVAVVTRAPIARWMVTVDATTGAVRQVLDQRIHAQGQVYEENPDVSGLITVELTDLTGDASVMEGTYAHVRSTVIVDEENTTEYLATADENGDFFFEPDTAANDDPFVEVHAYYHVTLASRYFIDVHGYSIDAPALVTTNYHTVDGGYDNAYFTMNGDGDVILVFGDGFVDFGYDSDVIYHEFGHAVNQEVADLNSWGGDESYDEYGYADTAGAIHEGLADYWSATLTDSPCMAEFITWPCLRDLDNDNTCPGDLVGESHADGEIIGGATWEIRELAGAEATDTMIYGALGVVSTIPSYAELAEAILEFAGDLEQDGDLTATDVEGIHAILEDRGMLACGRSLPLEDDQPFTLMIDHPGRRRELDEDKCAEWRDQDIVFPPKFQFAVTAPPAEEGIIEAINMEVEMVSADEEELFEDDLRYTWYVRKGELVTLEYIEGEKPNGNPILIPEADGYDLEFADNPTFIELTAEDDEAMPLEPGETYYYAMIHMNCSDVDLTLTPHLIVGPPVEGDDDDAADDDDDLDDDDDDDGGCNCRVDGMSASRAGARYAWVLGVGMMMTGWLWRRRG